MQIALGDSDGNWGNLAQFSSFIRALRSEAEAGFRKVGWDGIFAKVPPTLHCLPSSRFPSAIC
jgi:hypothetical protein